MTNFMEKSSCILIWEFLLQCTKKSMWGWGSNLRSNTIEVNMPINHNHYTTMAVCWVMVFNATFNNISVLLVEETGVLGENHWPVASHWQTLSHNVVSSKPRHEWESNLQL